MEQLIRILVGNTDPDQRMGQHWVAIYIDFNSKGEYYDPTGRPPFLRAYVNIMKKHCHTWTYNTVRIQEEGPSVCGHHCIVLPHSTMCRTYHDRRNQALRKSRGIDGHCK
jgi:hypothetical protein